MIQINNMINALKSRS